jgi:uncharacterized protein (DUF305 family)
MNFRTPTAIAVAATAALLLASCSGTAGSSSSSSGSMSGMSVSAAPSAAASGTTAAAASFNKQDVLFAQMMAAHHLQAVEMADVVLKKTGINPKITSLATTIKNEQKPEIDEMNGWLTSWGSKPVTDSMSGMGMGSGSGMMSMDDMTALAGASGAKASKLFLSGMITHHTGAIAMAQTETKNGKSADAMKLANSIITSQTAQIAEMEKLFASV